MPSPDALSIMDDAGRAAPMTRALGASMLPNVEDQIIYFAQRRFPDMPIEAAVRRYGVIDGNIVFADPQTGAIHREIASVTGATGPLDAVVRGGRWLASQVGGALPGIAAGVSGAVAGPTGTSIPIAGATAGLTDIVRQQIGNALIGRDDGGIDFMNAAGQGAMAGAGQGIAAGASRVLSRNPGHIAGADRSVAIDPATVAQANARRLQAQQDGIDLSFGQSTGIRSALVNERQLSRDAVSADTMADFYNRQRGQVGSAVEGFIDRDIARVPSVDEGVLAARGGAEDAIRFAKSERERVASPLYKEAFYDANGTPKTVKQEDVAGKAIDFLNRSLDRQPENSTLRSARDLFLAKDKEGNVVVRGGTVVLKTRVDQLHETKMMIDRLIEGADTGKPLDNATKRTLTELKHNLIEDGAGNPGWLAKASPEYDHARVVYRNKSPDVSELTEGIVGKVAGREGSPTANTLADMFDFRRATPTSVLRARAAYEASGSEDKWNAALATYLRDRFGEAQGSPGAFLARVYGNDANKREREVLQAAMTNSQFAGFQRLMQTLQFVSRTLPEGSQTATDLAGGQRLREQFGRSASGLANLFSPVRAVDIAGRLGDTMQRRLSDDGMRKLADAVTSPDSLKMLEELRMLPPWSEKAASITSQLLGVGIVGSSGIRDGRDIRISDRAPIAASR